MCFFFSSRRRHTRYWRDWSSDVCSSDLCTRGPWSRPAPGTFGNVARNSFFGPHFFNVDASLSKRFEITERWSAQFRAEMFNVFNHVNLGQPQAQVDSPTAGQIFGLASLAQMRKWQLGLRIQF